ncbi:2-hydroxyacyl-CoA dehydratase subunit D [Thermodesulfobacteriota bacterium]
MDNQTTPEIKQSAQYQGQIKAGARALVETWKQKLSRAQEEGTKVVWTFVPNSHHYELIASFDMPLLHVLPEFNGMRTCLMQTNQTYLDRAEEMGYSADVCGYLKIDAGMIDYGLQHPDMGKIPRPDLIICPPLCNTFLKWAEMWQDRFDTPVSVLDMPVRYVETPEEYLRSETYKEDKRFMLAQLEDLIEVLEKLSGKKFDPDKLAERQTEWNQVISLWSEILELNKAVPAPLDVFEDGFNMFASLMTYRGAAEPKAAIAYLETAKLEIEERIALGQSAVSPEKYRFVFSWAPILYDMRGYLDLFRSRGGVAFVQSLYLEVHETSWKYDTSRPLESLAEAILYVNMPNSANCFWNRGSHLLKILRDYSADALVVQAFKSCRLVSTPLLHLKEMAQEAGIPTLSLDGDLFEKRYFSYAATKNRIDAFFERIDSQRIRRQREGR